MLTISISIYDYDGIVLLYSLHILSIIPCGARVCLGRTVVEKHAFSSTKSEKR